MRLGQQWSIEMGRGKGGVFGRGWPHPHRTRPSELLSVWEVAYYLHRRWLYLLGYLHRRWLRLNSGSISVWAI